MEIDHLTVATRLLLAVLAGGVIGFERTFNGRPAGFRTHALVCTASALLVLVSVYQWELVGNVPRDTIRVDPTRMAQGIMTGIGFLGAGVIMKERLAIRGLTTAASIWITASIGVVIGMGFFSAAGMAVLITLGTLSMFRWLESAMPALRYGKLTVRFLREEALGKDELWAIIQAHHISATSLSYHMEQERRWFQYEMTVRTRDSDNFRRLSDTLARMERVHEFSIMPTGD